MSTKGLFANFRGTIRDLRVRGHVIMSEFGYLDIDRRISI